MDHPDLYRFLAENRIDFERCDHPAVFTVAEAARHVPPLPGAKTKNLFLRDKPGLRHYLVVVASDKQVDLRRLSAALGANRLSFGSPARLLAHLGVTPGAVSLLAVFNDPGHRVEVFVDADLWRADAFQFHPLVNTSTLVIPRAGMGRFLELTGHRLNLIEVPDGRTPG